MGALVENPSGKKLNFVNGKAKHVWNSKTGIMSQVPEDSNTEIAPPDNGTDVTNTNHAQSAEEYDDDDDRPLAAGSSVPDRMRYYQSRIDNDSSDEEGTNRSSSNQEYKSYNNGGSLLSDKSEDEEQETDGEYLSMVNEYAPLNDTGVGGGSSAGDDDDSDFGDFQTSQIASQLSESNIDSIIRGTLNQLEFAPRMMGDDFLEPSVKNPPKPPASSSAAAAVEDWQPFAEEDPLQTRRNDQGCSAPSIPPLTEGTLLWKLFSTYPFTHELLRYR